MSKEALTHPAAPLKKVSLLGEAVREPSSHSHRAHGPLHTPPRAGQGQTGVARPHLHVDW